MNECVKSDDFMFKLTENKQFDWLHFHYNLISLIYDIKAFNSICNCDVKNLLFWDLFS